MTFTIESWCMTLRCSLAPAYTAKAPVAFTRYAFSCLLVVGHSYSPILSSFDPKFFPNGMTEDLLCAASAELPPNCPQIKDRAFPNLLLDLGAD